MGRYLVVAHQTASSKELLDGLNTLKQRDPQAEFVLLVPATPSQQKAGSADRQQSAEAVAQEAARAFSEAQLTVLKAKVGDGLPLKAIGDEMESGEQVYNGIIISTLAPDISTWVGEDLPRRVERRWGLPVRHIVAGE